MSNMDFTGVTRANAKTNLDIATLYTKEKKASAKEQEDSEVIKDIIDISEDALQSARQREAGGQDGDIIQITVTKHDAAALQSAASEQGAAALKGKAGDKSVDDFQSKLEEMRRDHQALREGLRDAMKAGEGMAEAMKEKIRCLQIAMRIMSGDNVPEADKRYLAEKDIELFNQAISLRMEKKDPKEHDSLLEEEEDGDEEAAEEPVGGAESADVNAAPEAADAAQPPAAEAPAEA